MEKPTWTFWPTQSFYLKICRDLFSRSFNAPPIIILTAWARQLKYCRARMYHNLADPLFDINSFLFVWISYYFLKITFQIRFLVWKISPLKFLAYVVKISQSKFLLIMSENSHSSVPMLIVLETEKHIFFFQKAAQSLFLFLPLQEFFYPTYLKMVLL